MLVALLIFNKSLVAQDQFSKKPVVQNHNTSQIASSISYAGTVLDDNTLLFCNAGGVLQFDGSNWSLITTNENAAVLSLLYQDSIIYVAGTQEFGYLKRNKNKEYEYVSFNPLLGPDIVTAQFFQILAINGDIYYQTDGFIFRWDGKELHTITLDIAYIFYVDSVLYASSYKGLAIVRNDSVIYVNTSSAMHRDGAYSIYESSDPNTHTAYTGDAGMFSFNKLDNSINAIDNEVSRLFKREGFYSTVPYLDSLWVATTSDGSIVVYNEEGDILKQLDKGIGITGLYLRELFIDKRNKIWVTSDVGISEIYWPEFDTISQVKNRIHSVEVNGKLQDVNVFNDSLFFENSNIKIVFAALGFNEAEVQHSYKLEGFDETWSDFNAANTKEYTQLKGGNYTFWVKSKTSNGLLSEPVALPLNIIIPWYKTIWAYLFYCFIAMILVGLITWLRTIQLRISNKRLESVVAERTDEIQSKSEELLHANEDLNLKNQELDHFVYRSSHDLIAPLKSLKGLIYLAKSDAPHESQLEYLKHMETSVLKLEDFIGSIIDFTTNAKTEAQRVDIKLNEVLDDISQELKYFDRAEKVELIRNFEIETIATDPKRLRIILSNLISNSVKYHNYLQEKPFIEVKSYRVNGDVFIGVKDNGQGIKPELIDHIFDMFYRASDSSDGSGLGLYIVKDTVAKIHGELKVDSTYGEGSEFTLSLPA